MNIGELFVKLGIQGGDKTLGTLKENQKAFKGTASMALEAKAAILGAVYALQSLFRASNNLGSDLTNFNATLGVSAKTLQQYQYAARQVGVDNKAVEGSFRALQSAMTKTLMGEGAPKGLARVAQLTGDINPDDLLEFSKAPEKLIQRLQEYASKEKDAGFRNEVLKTFGLGDDMIAALNRQAFRPEVLAKAPTLSDKELGNLDKANVGWANLLNKIERAVARFNAQYGPDLVEGLSDITDQVIKLANALVELSNKLQVFEGLKSIIDALTFITGAGATTVDIVSGEAPSGEKLEGMDREADKFLSGDGVINRIIKSILGEDKTAERMQMMRQTLDKAKSPGYQNQVFGTRKEQLDFNKERAERQKNLKPLESAPQKLVLPPTPKPAEVAAPKMPAASAAQQNVSNQNITVNQTLSFPGGAQNPADAKRVHGEAVQKAYRQISAQKRSN